MRAPRFRSLSILFELLIVIPIEASIQYCLIVIENSGGLG
jgi:hypothetical protein